MQDSEIIARLIYAAWISPTPTDEDIAGFRAVMDCYARAARREETAEPEPCGDSCPIVFPDPDVSDSDRKQEPPADDPPDTHTHTLQPGPMTAESRRPSSSPATARAKRERSMRA